MTIHRWTTSLLPAFFRTALLSVSVSVSVIAIVGGCNDSPTRNSSKNTDNSPSFLVAETTDTLCSDGIDNDGAGGVDCGDLNCQQSPDVTVCRAESENSVALCSDGQDNDNDGAVDCADSDCEFLGCTEATDDVCSDGIDNNGNGFTDCQDFSCLYGCLVTVCDLEGPAEKGEAQCSDGLDNDGDGFADCRDFGCRDCSPTCAAGRGENTVMLCTDGQDNDDDGGIDCSDTECYRLDGVTGCDSHTENTPELCSDGQDNDQDPYIDCADRDCSGIGNCQENDATKCNDGVDNDGDTFIDCQDFDCDTFCGTNSTGTGGSTGNTGGNTGGGTGGNGSGAGGNNAGTGNISAIDSTIAAIQNESASEHPVFPTGMREVRVKLSQVTVTSTILTDKGGKNLFFVQDAFPPNSTEYHGIMIYTNTTSPTVSPGDVIDITGLYTEFYGSAQIKYESHTTISSNGIVTATQLLSQDLATATLAEPFEGVLVQLSEVKVAAINTPSRGGANALNEDFSVLEAAAPNTFEPVLLSTEFIPQAPAVGDLFGFVRGPLLYSWSQFRIAPRVNSDYGDAANVTADDDQDGLSNADENTLGTNPSLKDTDGDGVEDLPEVGAVSAPNDTDCDGIIDALESSIIDSDGDSIVDQIDFFNFDGPEGDPDGDSIVNRLDPNDDGDDFCDPGIVSAIAGDCSQLNDNCSRISNNDQSNADGDADGDACDADMDNDDYCNPDRCVVVTGVCSMLGDNCPLDANASQADNDSDGMGDPCDPDDDNDQICDMPQQSAGVCALFLGNADNCPLISNGTQANNDGDNEGDACDVDDDNDGICDPGTASGAVGCSFFGTALATDNCQYVINPDQLDTNNDGVGDACTVTSIVPAAGQIIFNEVLADPYGAGDANGDGVSNTQAAASSDEFIELVNISGGELDLAGCTISTLTQVRHLFTVGTNPAEHLVASKGAVVIFGTGSPSGTFGGATVGVASTGSLSLNNAGETLTLTCYLPATGGGSPTAVVVNTFSYGAEGGANDAMVLSPDGDLANGSWVLHNTLSSTGATAGNVRFSPGTCSNGVPFPSCLVF